MSKNVASQVGGALLELIYPARCPMCDAVMGFGKKGVCRQHKKLPFVTEPCCMKCGRELADGNDAEYCDDCMRRVRNFERNFPVFNYLDPVKSSILASKYHNKREYLKYYGEEMSKRIEPHLATMGLDGIIPVPVHKHKLKTRGYNQAELLARAISDEIGVPVYTNVLTRAIDTTPQKELSPTERANNIKEALACDNEKAALTSVLLVDDIYTTGATAEACTQMLLECGVEHVWSTTVCVGGAR